MKKLLTNPVAIIVTLIALTYFYSIAAGLKESKLLDPSLGNSFTSVQLPEGDTAFGGIFYEPYLNDTLPQYEYMRLKDSFERIKKDVDLINRSVMSNGQSVGTIGVASFTDLGFYKKSSLGDDDTLSTKMMDSIQHIGEGLHLL